MSVTTLLRRSYTVELEAMVNVSVAYAGRAFEFPGLITEPAGAAP